MGNKLFVSGAPSLSLSRDELVRMLFRGNRSQALLQTVVHARWTEDEVEWERVSVTATLAVASQARLPMLVARPLGVVGPLPVVIFAHGTAKGKADASMTKQMQRYAREFGSASVSFDSRYHGERAGMTGSEEVEAMVAWPKERREQAYVDRLIDIWRSSVSSSSSSESEEVCLEDEERPFIYDSALDAMRVVDYIESLPLVFDASRVGMTGISLGGMIAWFAAAADERIRVVAPIIGVQHFSYAFDHDKFQGRVESIQRLFDEAAKDLKQSAIDRHTFKAVIDKITPGLLDKYDAPNTLPLIAPRPLLIVNGELDHRCPIEAVEQLYRDLQEKHYAQAPKNISLVVGQGIKHAVSPDMWQAIDNWFQTFLFVDALPITATATAAAA